MTVQRQRRPFVFFFVRCRAGRSKITTVAFVCVRVHADVMHATPNRVLLPT